MNVPEFLDQLRSKGFCLTAVGENLVGTGSGATGADLEAINKNSLAILAWLKLKANVLCCCDCDQPLQPDRRYRCESCGKKKSAQLLIGDDREPGDKI